MQADGVAGILQLFHYRGFFFGDFAGNEKCGVSIVFLENSIRFDSLLTSLGVEHRYDQSEGDHSWRWWDMHIQDGLDYILK